MNHRPSLRYRCAPIAALLPAFFVACLFHTVASNAQAQSLSSYFIGNSLTWDSRPDLGLPTLASDAGLSLTTGFHIRCNGSLDHVANNPTDTCVSPNGFGRYTEALASNAWDAVTLQPFSSTNTPSTPRMEYEAMKSLIQLARQNTDNLDTAFYLYTGWMSATSAGTDFYNAWYDPTPIDPDTDLIRNAASFTWVYDELASDPDLAGVALRMIPVGDILAEIDQRMTLGTIPGFAGAEDLYRDDLHMNNLGWFVVSNTVLSTLFKADPTGTPTNNAFVLAPGQIEPIEITSELGSLIQNAIWDVVSTDPRTGVLLGDLNSDGFVGIDDLNTVLTNWNQNIPPGDPLADPTADGFVGIDDLNTVLANWNAGTPPGADAHPQELTNVPEPASLLIFASLLGLQLRRV
jgi:hypothetical protein